MFEVARFVSHNPGRTGFPQPPVRRCGLISALAIFATHLALAQVVTNITAPPVPNAGHDYIKMLNETVSPGSGSISLRIAIPTPEGRGLNLPFSITYNSNQTLILQPGSSGGLQWIAGNGPFSVSGWSVSIPSMSASVLTYNFIQQNPTNDGTTVCNMVTGFGFTDLNGVSHPFGLSYIYDNVAFNIPYPSVGVQPLDEACTASGFSNSQLLSNSGSNNFALSVPSGSSDGMYQASLTQIPADQTSLPIVEPSAGPIPVVAGSDGTVYTFNPAPYCTTQPYPCYSTPTTIEDRNGNILSFNQNASSGALTVNDTAGRSVITIGGFPPTPLSSPTTTTITGADGHSYTLTWDNVSYSGYSVGARTIPVPQHNCANITSIGTGGPRNAYVVKKITLPNGKFYSFTYDPTYGTLSQVTYPNGGYTKYTYAVEPDYGYIVESGPGGGTCVVNVERLMVATRQVGFIDSNGSDESPIETQSFQYADTSSNAPPVTTVITTDNLRADTSFTTKYGYILAGQGDVAAPLETSVIYYDSTGATLKTITKSWKDQFSLLCQVETNPSTGLSYGTIYGYSQADIQIDKKEYDYGNITTGACGSFSAGVPVAGIGVTPPSGTPDRETVTSLETFGITNYSFGASLADRPCKVVSFDSTPNPAAETDVLYDGGASVCGSPGTPSVTQVGGLPSGTHDETLYSSSSLTSRGNITKIVKKCFSCTDTMAQYTYDETGQPTEVIDALGHVTNIYHNDPGTINTNTYVTKIDPPHVNGISHAMTYQYNLTTGEVTAVTDVGNQVTTSFTYADPLNRLTEVDYPDGGKTGYCYTDVGGSYLGNSCLASSTFHVYSATLASPNPIVMSSTTYDGLGNPVETQINSAPGGAITSITNYDGLSRIMSVTNPYQISSTGSISYTYDALGRKIMETEQDDSNRLWCYDGLPNAAWSACPANQSSFSSGTWTNSQDESGNISQHISDGLGRLRSSMEELPAAGSLGLETDYTYNALNDLTNVNQKGVTGTDTARIRTFTYTSLSQLVSSGNPETGTIWYTYDANGNLVTKTDGRNITTNYGYDGLNRLTSKTYSYASPSSSDGTPSSCYLFDTSSGGIGRLGSEWTQSAAAGECGTSAPSSSRSAHSILLYDAMGRVLQDQRCTGSGCSSTPQILRPMKYTYDLAGNPIGSGDGVGNRSFVTQYDAAGRLFNFAAGMPGNATPLFTVQSYNPFGLTGATIGSSMTLSKTYDSRTTRLTGEMVIIP